MNQFITTNALLSLDQGLKLVYEKMIQHQQKGQYVDAERCRLEWQHRKEQLKNRQLYQMDLNHKRERNQLHNDLMQELKRLNNFWTTRMEQFKKQSDQNIKNMNARHQDQCKRLENELNIQLSTKVKQSSELLNLRKMEEQMAKQKNYVEAHRVQQKIKKLFAHQEQNWLERRTQKINQALFNLRNKQSAELANLKKRIKTTQQDNAKDHHFENLTINQRYENSLKDLKARQQREALSFRGQFKTLGGGSPTSSPNRSNMSIIKV